MPGVCKGWCRNIGTVDEVDGQNEIARAQEGC